jgi:toxin ParE1/3/4
MKKQIRFSELSRADLKQIYRYIASDSPARGRKLVSELTECCEQAIADHPQIGRVRSEIYNNLRSFAFKRYVIFYREVDEVIEIVRILHGSRDVDLAFS